MLFERDKKIGMKSRRKYLLMISAAFILHGVFAQDGTSVSYTLEPQSRLWIDGSSTINTFTFVTSQVKGYAYLQRDHKDADQNRPKVYVLIPVRSLDGGNRRMNEDMFEAMKADSFPEIRYELIAGELIDKPDSSGEWFQLKTKGYLSIAGEKNTIEMIVRVKQIQDGRFQVVGRKTLSMLDYGITPPTALWGLIRAHNRLVIRFDLVAGILYGSNAKEIKPEGEK